jgi:hypothetical protein
MLIQLAARTRARVIAAAIMMAAVGGASPLVAQGIQTIDPDTAIDGDLAAPQTPAPAAPTVYDGVPTEPAPTYPEPSAPVPASAAPAVTAQPVAQPANASAQDVTYHEDDLIGAAEGVFGKGAQGLANLIKDILAKQGEPNAYIVGREASGAFILGARYGSGTLYHKVEGQQPIYWTGPSIGFDAGANAGSTFVLVYNLYDTEQLFERYPAGEGAAYLVGGFNASYLRKGDVVLIPIRVGAGLRLGVNAGYMKFSHKQRWLPF